MRQKRLLLALSLALAVVTLSPPYDAGVAETKRPFTVTDEIGLQHFGDPYNGTAEAVEFSFDGSFVAVYMERGRLDVNRPEDTLLVYSARDILTFISAAPRSPRPKPILRLTYSTCAEGPIISQWRWVGRQNDIAFLQCMKNGNDRLMIVDLRKGIVQALTPDNQKVLSYALNDRANYIYVSQDIAKQRTEHQAAAYSVTGESLFDILFPQRMYPPADRGDLWAVTDAGKPKRVIDPETHRPMFIFSEGQRALSLSPDNRLITTVLPVQAIPQSWGNFSRYPNRLHAGPQDLLTLRGYGLVGRYVVVDLGLNRMRTLVDGPTGLAAGWWTNGKSHWSRDGRVVILPDAFIEDGHSGKRTPCVTAIDLVSGEVSCVQSLAHAGPASGDGEVFSANFVAGDVHRVVVEYRDTNGTSTNVEYVRELREPWTRKSSESIPLAGGRPLDMHIVQGPQVPPRLIGSNIGLGASRLVLDPNLQLERMALARVEIFSWKDRKERRWKAGLFLPPEFDVKKRYPLIIQTHGFSPTEFRPSGVFPTAFAAQALASVGIIVLQVQDCAIAAGTDEASCNLDGYKSAIGALHRRGFIDTNRIGLIGFSRTCYYVMAALTSNKFSFNAASITDGVVEDYFQYLSVADVAEGQIAADSDLVIGSPPFGKGLIQWMKRSPGFNLEEISAPLMITGIGKASLLSMWGPYAGLRYLKKPVDMIVLASDQHILTNPSARLASQGGTVDWFRFWLQGYEDSDPAKRDQYRRWEKLCDLQITNVSKARTFCVPTHAH